MSGERSKRAVFVGRHANVGPIEAGYTSSIRRTDERALEMTDKVNGKIVTLKQNQQR